MMKFQKDRMGPKYAKAIKKHPMLANPILLAYLSIPIITAIIIAVVYFMNE